MGLFSKKSPSLEFAKVFSKKKPISQRSPEAPFFRTVNNEIRVFLEYYLTFMIFRG